MATQAIDHPKTVAEAKEFHLFASLPSELRLQVWISSFKPRVVALHGGKAHYADAFRYGSTLSWRSCSMNPAALSVSSEARRAALSYYYLRIPIAISALNGHSGHADRERILYLNPTADTIAMLGDLDFYRLSTFLSDLRRYDPAGKGLARLAVSSQWTSHGGAGKSIQTIVGKMFPSLEEFIVYLCEEDISLDKTNNGTYMLEDCRHKDIYKEFEKEGGRYLRDGKEWMVIGKRQLYILQLTYKSGG